MVSHKARRGVFTLTCIFRGGDFNLICINQSKDSNRTADTASIEELFLLFLLEFMVDKYTFED